MPLTPPLHQHHTTLKSEAAAAVRGRRGAGAGSCGRWLPSSSPHIPWKTTRFRLQGVWHSTPTSGAYKIEDGLVRADCQGFSINQRLQQLALDVDSFSLVSQYCPLQFFT
uniref:Uncharacterized protein n=1 Tax=Setaria viridis TaxID=4556 RepID=A0A4U6TFN0_SETVI|nr:hypothetical protein SEVIR_8G154350v2 [Setaria viridis]